MIVIDTDEKLAALRASASVNTTTVDLIESRMHDVRLAFAETGWDWDPAEHGAFAVVEDGDGRDAFAAVGLNPEAGLIGAVWESCYRHRAARVFEILVLYCGDTGWSFYVPDAPWLPDELRAKIAAEAVDPTWEADGAGPAGAPF